MNIKNLRNLFLSQSYKDAIDDYYHALEEMERTWDYVILTASNEAQATVFRNEIKSRLEKGMIPAECNYAILPDSEGKRVGSGGATFNVLRYIAELQGDKSEEKRTNSFGGKRILVIHSGGDSKRVPQYSVCGKLFSPVPRELPNGRASTLFDEFLIIMSSVSKRISDGMLVLSGDVLLLFNPLQLDLQFKGAAAISIKEHVSIGKEHGVFLQDENGYVKQFLHKQSEENLRLLGAVNEQDYVDLDTGAVLFDTELMNVLWGLVSVNGVADEGRFSQFVNDRSRISFYGDFLYPLASQATLEDYIQQAPEGERCEELFECRRLIWDSIHDYQMKVFGLSPAEFIHFGTTLELQNLLTKDIGNYELLGWSGNVSSNIEGETAFATNTCVVTDSRVGAGAYIENAILQNADIGEGAVISGLELSELSIPAQTVFHGVELDKEDERFRNGNYVVRCYDVADNPKNRLSHGDRFLGTCVKDVLNHYGIEPSEIWDDLYEDYLWFAKLYIPAKTWKEAAEEALLVYRIFKLEASDSEVKSWLNARRVSLSESFNLADVNSLTRWRERLDEEIVLSRFLTRLEGKKPYREALAAFDGRLLGTELDRINQAADGSALAEKIRIYYALSLYEGIDHQQRENYSRLCFSSISEAMYQDMTSRIEKRKFEIAKDTVRVSLPVRVNWGGGWTDTPPYCLEEGGLVLNAALKLNGELPIVAEMKRIPELRIKVSSTDIGVEGYIDSVDELLDCHNPYDYYALHKAALIACGLVSLHDEKRTLPEILESIGGGFELTTRVIGIPKGSGLGTSSILSAACVKAFYEFMGCTVSDDDTIATVSCMEQIMSTGGGWQDQVGGILPGIKYISTKPGISQKIRVEYVKLADETWKELDERFALIYTGQRRLARNLLRDVVGNYIGARPESVAALHEMKRVANGMRFELENGNIDGFAALLNRHWELSLQLDQGASNTCIDQIVLSIDDLIDGRFIAGAGGGGFLQVILKKNVTGGMLHNRLQEVFQGTGIDVWGSEFMRADMEDELC